MTTKPRPAAPSSVVGTALPGLAGHHTRRETMKTINEYEIGGICVLMTAAAADRWNTGDWTDADDEKACVVLPDQYAQHLSLRNGEVVLHDPLLVKAVEKITMREALERGLHDEFMDGMPANLIRLDV